MLMAIIGILVFGALIAIPRWLRVVKYDPAGLGNKTVGPQLLRPRWPRFGLKRNAHARGQSRGKSPHHAGL